MSVKQLIVQIGIGLVCLTICSCAEEPPPPSLYDTYHKKGVNAFVGKTYDSAIYYWEKAMEVAEANGNKLNVAASQNNIAIGLNHQGQLKKSLLSYEKALATHREQGIDTLIAGTLVNVAQAYTPYDKSRSAELLYEAVGILERLEKENPKLINAYNTLGNVEQNREAYENAIELHEKALSLARKVNPSKVGYTYHNLGADYLEMGQWEPALEYLFKSLDYKDSLRLAGEPSNIEITYYALGRAYLAGNKYDKAEHYFNLARAIYSDENNKDQIAYVDIRLAELELQRNRYETAAGQINKASVYAPRASDPELQREYQEVRYQFFMTTSQYEKAANLLNEILAIKKRVLDEKRQVQLTMMEVEYDVDQLDQTIQGQEVIIRNNRTIIILAIAAVILLAIVLVFIYINYRQADRRRLIEKKAREQEAKQKEEIRQLHEEMYHRVKNNLSTFSYILKLEAERYSTDETREALRDQKNRLTAISTIHSKLYLAQDSDKKIALNLKTYLFDLANEILYSFRYNNKVELITEMDRLDLDMDRALLLGQLLNESLTNAFKYAVPGNPAPQVTIRLVKTPSGEWKLEVKDNGKGIKAETPDASNSLGMKIFKNLTNQLKAKWYMHTTNGVGHTWVFMP
ncbi:tetratricopeptide repeat protein [Roseivirga sp. BDSF3-8]|uniref:tetratricopeptide repeat-containing sensor histidine kinase n=1 Tax=Roseivirga sp. BDSF3-8 TaxID=3241598 RepID=UPI0035322AAB